MGPPPAKRAFVAAMFAQARSHYRFITDSEASWRQPLRGSLRAQPAAIRCLDHLTADANASAQLLSSIANYYYY